MITQSGYRNVENCGYNYGYRSLWNFGPLPTFMPMSLEFYGYDYPRPAPTPTTTPTDTPVSHDHTKFYMLVYKQEARVGM